MSSPTSKTFCGAFILSVAILSSVHSFFTTNGRHVVRDTRIQQPSSQQWHNKKIGNSRIFNNADGTSSESEEPLSLFEESVDNNANITTTMSPQCGESVPLRRNAAASFGESVPLRTSNTTTTTTPQDLFATTTTEESSSSSVVVQDMKRRNLGVAVASVLLAVTSYVWQFTHPITPVQLLATMQASSAPLTAIGTNGRPTVVDFWAPWCENCKQAAPTLAVLEEEYKDRVNFVMINGDRPEAFPLIERFGVDAIPHMALISAQGDVETALIGPIPKRVLQADLEVLLDNAAKQQQQQDDNNSQEPPKELPYKMLDVFAKFPEYRRVKFVLDEPGE
ncbi:Thioredoxin-like protein HCF164, chloroplastic [Seminavis robusta]|uniref:Thioredoxin-like protein HCF164, chloroplastic n=1 Tax=Seminavis robusta TaxID=568900 RepID=A0A9N8EU63_9STRA|nr:Thioredoxin-like protein HCF164, chloroplastic [Seminavis robusta]|eukprot:Sro1699_g292040.1 Thioredoxin-like protein HCF164, chloroplastic (336) ;mRNA; f:12261-13268